MAGSLSAPGPPHLDWPGEPFTAIAAWPVVWIPALLAPPAILLHAASIRQSLARLAPVTGAVRWTRRHSAAEP